jgi:hypothetical protein
MDQDMAKSTLGTQPAFMSMLNMGTDPHQPYRRSADYHAASNFGSELPFIDDDDESDEEDLHSSRGSCPLLPF